MDETRKGGESERLVDLARKLAEVHQSTEALVYEHVVAQLIILRMLLQSTLVEIRSQGSFDTVFTQNAQVEKIRSKVEEVVNGEAQLLEDEGGTE